MEPTDCGERTEGNAVRSVALGGGGAFDSLFQRHKCCTEEGRAMLGDDGIQTDSATHPMGAGSPFPGCKATGA
jgi:hypothetical protein